MASATHHQQHKARQHLRKGQKHEKGKDIKADINVTPLVDVVLVLLIIFMVVTPLITSGVQVDLPRTSNHSKKADDGKDIIVSVTTDKRIFIMQKQVKIPELPRVVEDEKRRFPEKTIYIKGDHRTTYGAVREVMESIHKAGIEDVMLGTEEIKSITAAKP
jgi:biopolymer transport protein ExbD